jgi:ATP-dependent helicase/nuclease subunit B
MAPGAGEVMQRTSVFRIVESASAAARLDAAAAFLRRFRPDQPVTIVAATRGAADDLARRLAMERGATIGLSRFSLTQLAARVAATRLAGAGIAPSTGLGAEAVATRVAFDAARAGTLSYFHDVAETPGFPRALARTLAEVRLTAVPSSVLGEAGAAGRDLARLLDSADAEFAQAATADRARLFAAAADGVRGQSFLRAPLLLLDLAVDTRAEETFVAALTASATETLATVALHDAAALDTLLGAGGTVERIEDARATDLASLRAYLFADDTPAPRQLDGSLQFFSAPGEGRECVEIARRILSEARRGVAFDEMAIFVRSPQHYQGLLEHALERARVPAWFDRGTRRPHPAGRAFLALLACAAEGLSAARFAEYLSLGQLPEPDQDQPGWRASEDEVFGAARQDVEEDGDAEPASAEDEQGRPAHAGSLRTPRRWERMIVEAAVIGGEPARWTRRLDGLAQELQLRLVQARREDAQSARVTAIDDDRARLDNLRAFALPLITEMAGWPALASWGDWLDRLDHLAPRTLRVPAYVLRVLADLRPMASVGPVSINEVRLVLGERLRSVDREPPSRRYGRVFVGSPSQARGRAFRIVFVPGLAERMFPRKSSQDPLLLDETRERLNAGSRPDGPAEAGAHRDSGRLATRGDQSRRERVLLHLAAGAAIERLYVSYPRLDVAESRVRVPSFYALDLLRGATGAIPDHETLAAEAAAAGDPTLAWPAPRNPDLAIDDQEHDLAVLRLLLDAGDPASVRGHAQYMLRLNPALRRSVTERWGRGQPQWSHLDGLTRVAPGTREALEQQRLGNRPYSLSALQKFSACPYQFVLSAMYRLEPAEQPQPLQRLDPLTRGSIVHSMQAEVFRALQRSGALPVTSEGIEEAVLVLEEVIGRVAEDYRERLAPAIDRVWREEIAVIARDLRGWLRRMAEEGGSWVPRHFELSFGLPLSPDRDPSSSPAAATIDGRFPLRGAVDLVEEHRDTGALRVTDHKTGKDRTKDNLTIGGGATLQPVLYSMAIEQVTGRSVTESRLFFCTSAGGYKVRPVPLTAQSRRMGVEALEVIDRAIELGFLAAAPSEGACVWCDFRAVCGPNEERRVARKPIDRLRDLLELRSRP